MVKHNVYNVENSEDHVQMDCSMICILQQRTRDKAQRRRHERVLRHRQWWLRRLPPCNPEMCTVPKVRARRLRAQIVFRQSVAVDTHVAQNHIRGAGAADGHLSKCVARAAGRARAERGEGRVWQAPDVGEVQAQLSVDVDKKAALIIDEVHMDAAAQLQTRDN